MRSFHLVSLVSCCTAALGLFACTATTDVPSLDAADDDESAERWNNANNPNKMDSTFIYEADKLPVEGKAKNPPIPADYWATYQDSINVRWDGENSLSAAEKYEKAFNRPGTALAVSQNYGIRAQTSRKECTQESDCSDQKDGSSCSIARGETKGRCIPTWWGICHGWAPFAFSEAAPLKPVVRGDVTFYPADLEGLGSLVYSVGLPTKFLSERCNKEGTGDRSPVTRDANGRVTDSECRDMNPGAFHVVATNMLGIRQTSFVEDRTWDSQVWNQPVFGYKITNLKDGKLTELTKTDAVSRVGLGMVYTDVQALVTLKKGETKAGSYTAPAAGTLVFRTKGTGDADLYVKKGGAASSASADCKSTGNTSDEECKVTVTAGENVGWSLLGYSETSTVSMAVGAPTAGEPAYTFNLDAVKFYYVEMDFQYVSEASPSRESRVPTVQSFVRTDHYQYILEVDGANRVIGGEWLGESRTKHPDFVWWPSGKPNGSVAGGKITYAEVKALLDESAGAPTQPAPQAETRELLKDQVVRANYSVYPTIGAPGGSTLTVTMTGTGNSDLYVRLGGKPTTTSYNCRSNGATSAETCTVKVPAGGGTYYVRVRPMTAGTVSVTATITP